MPGASSEDSGPGRILFENLSVRELLKALETVTLAGSNSLLEGSILTRAPFKQSLRSMMVVAIK